MAYMHLMCPTFNYLLEAIVDFTSNPVCLKSQIHILATSIINVVLVQNIIQTLIKVLQVEKNNCTPSLHANLNLVDVAANLFQTIVKLLNESCRLYPLNDLST